MKPTMEQRRAAHAWECARRAKVALGGGNAKDCYTGYVNVAKGLPALIMNSGLMQVAAFLHQKGDQHATLLNHLLEWLHEQCGTPADFPGFMNAMMEASPQKYRTVNAEAMAWLRWLRQMAPAVENGVT